VQKIYWWSDGGPHFRNTILLGAFAESQETFGRDIASQFNWFEPHHGKSECDSIFGHYAQLLSHNLPSQGIHSFNELFSFFQRATHQAPWLHSVGKAPHTFLECASLSFFP
jgi:hypothetical protein